MRVGWYGVQAGVAVGPYHLMVAVPGAFHLDMSSSPGAAVRLLPAWCGLGAVLVQSGAEALQQRCEADRWDWTRSIARKHGDGTARHSQATKEWRAADFTLQ